MILHLIHTSVLKELWYDKSFFLCLNKKLSDNEIEIYLRELEYK